MSPGGFGWGVASVKEIGREKTIGSHIPSPLHPKNGSLRHEHTPHSLRKRTGHG